MTGGDSKAGLRFLALGTEFAAAVVGLTLVGYWVDRHFGTAPWSTVTGAMIGLVGGMYNLLRQVLPAVRRPGGSGGPGGPGGDAGPGRGEPR